MVFYSSIKGYFIQSFLQRKNFYKGKPKESGKMDINFNIELQISISM